MWLDKRWVVAESVMKYRYDTVLSLLEYCAGAMGVMLIAD